MNWEIFIIAASMVVRILVMGILREHLQSLFTVNDLLHVNMYY